MSQSPGFLLIASSTMHRTPAFERAVALARACGASLRILALDCINALQVMGIVDPLALGVCRDSYWQAHRSWLEEQAEQERGRGLDCTVEGLWTDHGFDAISAFIQTNRPSMLIKDVHHEPLFARVFSTPLDWHLLRDCGCPIQFVTDARHPLPCKVLAAVNLYRYQDIDLQLNERLIKVASDLARQCGASVQVLYSYDWSAVYAANLTIPGVLPIEAGFHEALGEAQAQALACLCERHAVAPQCRHFLSGPPQPTISAFAREHAIDVLVMGTLPRRRMEKIIGDTAQALLSHAPCSVLVVKPVDGPDDGPVDGLDASGEQLRRARSVSRRRA